MVLTTLKETLIKTSLKTNLTWSHCYHGALTPVVKSPVAQFRQLISASHKNFTVYAFWPFTSLFTTQQTYRFTDNGKSRPTWGDSDRGAFSPVVKAVTQSNNPLSTTHKNHQYLNLLPVQNVHYSFFYSKIFSPKPFMLAVGTVSLCPDTKT